MKVQVLLLALLTVSECDRKISGRRGLNITLPCSYDIKTNGPTEVCWGRGTVPFRGCSDQLLATNGHNVIAETRVSSRYQLQGRLEEGDVSLTIMNITEEDNAVYLCRVQVPGLFNDEKHRIQLTVKTGSDCDDDGVIAFAGEEVTLPCRYNRTSGGIPVCWNRGTLSIIGCKSELLATDGSRVKEDRRVSSRYQLLGLLDEGDVSLTIRNIKEEDTGLYACRVQIPGFLNDEVHYVDLSVVKDQDLQHALEQFAAECEAAGKRISTAKSEAMVLDRRKLHLRLLDKNNRAAMQSAEPAAESDE